MTDKEKFISILQNQESGVWDQLKIITDEDETEVHLPDEQLKFVFDRFTGKLQFIVNYK